ncbi:bifunctional 23S rRNA (guanine(2069)-N(7))-methyltransferase RlmK/23S rRNA (guanine(2445)-N(2))-methyltransferase RlmL [Candidatus Magnetaquicoccus inordinatus]|uniref:bifunctional 23S rRNA (guanine(2069)-N(7))-methyltransferase RlmK/23S rRNA (guanine(2445)-N(2))-methyltransferase RlmL n=1 Tax=Candidatus Magnetaquicoccus inordinatus TaxID=2496818 RepID=UPI00102D188F|nr:bifunctional 23S rRNA (guanine(2069)-N(7))-methyltransferase RlmK/23S rRNA (guanine(2445)-N(2))-methyltransferase RlmL [Candidatus Magnetaquicoccus inordinatus]
MDSSLFITTAAGFEPLLANELRQLGASAIRPGIAGVACLASPHTTMRIALWSRVASRILLPLAKIPGLDSTAFHQAIQEIPWEEYLHSHSTFAVDFTGTNSLFRHSHFGALKVKDAIVDRFRSRGQERPSINTEQPDLRIHLRLQADKARLSLDLSGNGLHRRGWRLQPTSATLRETLAAAILLFADWPQIAAQQGALLDPMCGSGTLVIEAAWIAANIAPGLLQKSFGFHRLPGFDSSAWNELRSEAQQQAEQGLRTLPPLFAWDHDPSALRAAQQNIRQAGLAEHVQLALRPLQQLSRQDPLPDYGLLVVNPPYGVRQEEEESLPLLYQQLGEKMRQVTPHWQRALFTSRAELLKNVGLRPAQDLLLHNGPLPCHLWIFAPEKQVDPQKQQESNHFANRLQKNCKQLLPWARREDISCLRLYDADMPEYAAAIDLYGEWVHFQEYQPPSTIAADKASLRAAEMLHGITQVLQIPPERIISKLRHMQKKNMQYGKQDNENHFIAVQENGLLFWINLSDYLDSGLFLDQRLLRQQIRQMAPGKRFLNLFAYTASATVYAIAGGALSTTSVDLSRTYLAWAERNLTLNQFALQEQHQLIQEDCLQWIQHDRQLYDLILLAPPTFSNSKRMANHWEVDRDHPTLINHCCQRLAPGGTLLFITHARRFQLQTDKLSPKLQIQECSRLTLPRDFQRNPHFHRTWMMKRL